MRSTSESKSIEIKSCVLFFGTETLDIFSTVCGLSSICAEFPNPLSFLGGDRFLIKPVVKGIASNIAELHRGGFIDLTFTLVAGKVCSIFDEKGFLPAKIATFQVSANLYVFFVVQAIHIAIDGAVWAHPTWINRKPDLGDGRRSQLYSGIVPLDLLYWVGTFNFCRRHATDCDIFYVEMHR